MATEGQRGGAVGGAGIVAAVALALAAPAAHGAGATAPVAAGDYEAAPVVDEGGTYSTGLFSVAREAGKRTVVPTEGFDAIFYPDIGKCDQLALPLLASDVPIKRNGRFHVKERTPVEAGAVEVDWKGRWTKAKRVSGSITIKLGGCSSTASWTGRKVG